MSTNPDNDWMIRAACWDCAPALFSPENTLAAAELKEQAKQICQHCEVRVRCLNFALDTRQERGIWGGTDETERARLRRRWDRIEIFLFDRSDGSP